ncbi:MAG: PAS domain-containing protein [Variovorax sp.]|nr:MAG: PAS domain-containing protein [Variovorax sp.]
MEIPEKPRLDGYDSLRAQGTPGEVAEHKDDIFFAAIEMTRMPMLVTDPRQPDNPIVFANRAFISMSGYSPEEIVGHNCRFLQGPATDKSSVAAIREAVHAERQVQMEILNYRKDGSTFWNALFISPVYDPSGKLVYFFASQLDVSRRRDAEEGLAQAQKMEALGQLTGGISHDFNNLLQVMSGHLDLLDLRLNTNKLEADHVRRGVDNLRSAVNKAATLTQQLLAFSRKQSLRGRAINLNATVESMAELAGRTLGESVDVRFDLDPELGTCQLDPTQFEVALLNVLVNARDAMQHGGTITLATQNVEILNDEAMGRTGLALGRYASLSITDTGQGIDPQLLPRVMDPFFTTKDEGKGTGLGLSMVYGFVKQSGGNVLIDSVVGKGTTVTLYFPVLKTMRRPAAEVTLKPLNHGGSEFILIVEDRQEVAELARDMLESLGYKALTASNARQALELFNAQPDDARPQLLFSDVVMPGGINGYTLARQVQKLSPGTRVLLTTGFDRDMGSANQIESEEFDIIKKPYRLSDLARKVRAVLDGPTGSGRSR